MVFDSQFFFQVEKFGIFFDYKSRRCHVGLWYLGTLIVSLILVLVTFFSYKIIPHEFGSVIAVFFCSHLSHHFVTATLLTTYYIVIHYLCGRFDVLNALLKYVCLLKNAFVFVFIEFNSILLENVSASIQETIFKHKYVGNGV